VIRRIESARCGSEKCCQFVRQEGSHKRFDCRCGENLCSTTVPDHGARDLTKGTLRSIERDLEPCLGKGWLRR
jgi:predicted RNA binding protein YcfA (HicA-like mRNA interferase family)